MKHWPMLRKWTSDLIQFAINSFSNAINMLSCGHSLLNCCASLQD